MSSPACLTSQFQSPCMNARDGTYPELTLSLTRTQQVCACRIWLQEVPGGPGGSVGVFGPSHAPREHKHSLRDKVDYAMMPYGHEKPSKWPSCISTCGLVKRKEKKTKPKQKHKNKIPSCKESQAFCLKFCMPRWCSPSVYSTWGGKKIHPSSAMV